MVNVNISLDDLGIVVEALESADFYINDTEENEKKFYDHKDELRWRLDRLLKKWGKIKEIDEKIRWNKSVVRLGRGFTTYDEFMETQHALLDERRNIKEKERF